MILRGSFQAPVKPKTDGCRRVGEQRVGAPDGPVVRRVLMLVAGLIPVGHVPLTVEQPAPRILQRKPPHRNTTAAFCKKAVRTNCQDQIFSNIPFHPAFSAPFPFVCPSYPHSPSTTGCPDRPAESDCACSAPNALSTRSRSGIRTLHSCPPCARRSRQTKSR